MPSRPLALCSAPGCPNRVKKGRCQDHQRSQAGPWTEFYGSAAWQRLRRQVKREQPICADPRCDKPTEQVDHIVPLEDGGAPLDRANVQGLCLKHHQAKTAADAARRRRSRARARR